MDYAEAYFSRSHK